MLRLPCHPVKQRVPRTLRTRCYRPARCQGARPKSESRARERILEAAYELFSQHGIRAVGVDAIVARSGVARMTLYRHFPSKEALALAFLERREQLWTKDWLQREVERRTDDPRARLLAIFDTFDTWFRRDDFEGAPSSTSYSRSANPPTRSTAPAATTSPRFATSSKRSPQQLASQIPRSSRANGTSS